MVHCDYCNDSAIDAQLLTGYSRFQYGCNKHPINARTNYRYFAIIERWTIDSNGKWIQVSNTKDSR